MLDIHEKWQYYPSDHCSDVVEKWQVVFQSILCGTTQSYYFFFLKKQCQHIFLCLGCKNIKLYRKGRKKGLVFLLGWKRNTQESEVIEKFWEKENLGTDVTVYFYFFSPFPTIIINSFLLQWSGKKGITARLDRSIR